MLTQYICKLIVTHQWCSVFLFSFFFPNFYLKTCTLHFTDSIAADLNKNICMDVFSEATLSHFTVLSLEYLVHFVSLCLPNHV